MNIGLNEVAKILSISEDEVMYLHQSNKIQAGVDQDSLAWMFDLDEILLYKQKNEKEQQSVSSDSKETGETTGDK